MIIAEKKKDVAVSSDFKTSGFTIQASAKAFEILSSNIYTYKVEAVIREISCNAYDSHVAAKNPDPFKVHLPTSLEPWFSVRDFGIGLSDESIREIYTTYFFSTKTNSNDYIGALGLGSKSPFCLVDSFLVTSWKDGVKNSYSCYKDENGEPQIALLTSENSDEPNGVEVHLTVRSTDIWEFHSKAVKVYKYFDKLPTINIKEVVDSIQQAQNYKLVTDWYSVSASGYSSDIVAVMGNVAYEIPQAEFDFPPLTGFIKFEIGELSFNPGRESLSLDKKTKEAIVRKLDKLQAEYLKKISEVIDAEPNKLRKHWLAINFMSTKGVDKCKEWKDAAALSTSTPYNYYRKSYRKSVTKITTMEPPAIGTKIYRSVVGFERRVEAYHRHNGGQAAVLTDVQIAELDVPADLIHDMTQLPKLSSYRASTTTTSVRNLAIVKYNSTGHSAGIVKDVPDEEKVYVVLHGREDCLHESHPNWSQHIYQVRRLLKTLLNNKLISEDFVFYGVRSSIVKTKKFNKDGTWIRFEDFIRDTLDNVELLSYNNLDENDFGTIKNFWERTGDERMKFVDGVETFKVHDLPDFIKVVDHPIVQQVTDFMNKYPMLKYFDMPYASAERKIAQSCMKDYLNLVDGK